MAAKTRKLPKTKNSDELVPVQFRFPRGLLDLLDARLETMRAERPGLGMTRTDLVRDILYSAVQPKEK